jgi:hypothetical protein
MVGLTDTVGCPCLSTLLKSPRSTDREREPSSGVSAKSLALRNTLTESSPDPSKKGDAGIVFASGRLGVRGRKPCPVERVCACLWNGLSGDGEDNVSGSATSPPGDWPAEESAELCSDAPTKVAGWRMVVAMGLPPGES